MRSQRLDPLLKIMQQRQDLLHRQVLAFCCQEQVLRFYNRSQVRFPPHQ